MSALGRLKVRISPWVRDPRHIHIFNLSAFLIVGLVWLDFSLGWAQALTCIGVAVGTQYVATHLWRLPFFDPRSAICSGLSLCLLLRTNSLAWAAAAAALSIGSKFIFRWNDKHLFVPTAFGLVAVLLLTDNAWVSAGQWGSTALIAFLALSLGTLVTYRSDRVDVTLAFLVSYVGMLFGRAIWLGDPLTIPLHQIQNGALLVFAFFMISDPKPTPDRRLARVLYAFMIAAGAYGVQFGLYRTNGLLWSLVIVALLVPVLDRLLPGRRYHWPTADSPPQTEPPDFAPLGARPKPA